MTRRLRFRFGDVVQIEGVEYIFNEYVPAESGRASDPQDLQFLDRRARMRARCLTERQFLELHADGKVSWPDRLAHPADKPAEPGAPDTLTRQVRHFWLTTFDNNPVPKSSGPLKAFITQYAAQQPGPPGWTPSHNTLRTWLRTRGAPGDRKLKYMGDRLMTGPRIRAQHPQINAAFDQAAAVFWRDRRKSYKDVFEDVAGAVNAINRERRAEGRKLLKAPSRPSIWRWLKRDLTYDNARSRYGEKVARRLFQALRGSLEADRILDVAIIDHKRMDIFVVTPDRRHILGRPWLTAIVDVRSRMVLGVYLSFEDPSVLSAMACLRMALKPKLDLQAKFGLDGEWETFGVPRTILADNGWELVGSSFQDACTDLGISVEWAPVRTPEYKGICERFFRRLDDQLVHKLPGSIPMKPHLLEQHGIDPQADAILTLAELDRWLHHYLVDIYPLERHEALGAAPLKVWRERPDLDHVELGDLQDIDQALAKHVKDRVLSREGVHFLGLTYTSLEVTSLLSDLSGRQSGRKVRLGNALVKIKYHPEDISRIFVWNEVRGTYVVLHCTQADYADRLSERLHKELVKADRDADREFGSEMERCEKKANYLRALDQERDKKSIAQRRREARLTSRPDQAKDAQSARVSTVAIIGASNRRGGDNPEKAPVRSGRKSRSDKPTSRSAARAGLRASAPASRSSPIDPFAHLDRAQMLDKIRERRK